MTLDATLACIVAAAVEPLRAELGELRALVAQMAARGDALESLAEIDRISVRAAAARVRRDPALAALGVRVGRRLLFRRAEIEALRRGRGR